MRSWGDEPVLARTVARSEGLPTLRQWARVLLTERWSEQTLLDALVVLEELASHVCEAGDPARVRLSYRSGNCLRIEIDDDRVVPVPLGSDVGAVLIRHLSRALGVHRHPRHITLWADISLFPRQVPAALPDGRVLAPFEPAEASRN